MNELKMDLNKHDVEVLKHMLEVGKNILKFIKELQIRAILHDGSKLESPEREIYAQHSDELAKVEYGSPEYKLLCDKVRPAIEHHYSKNRHHPEHFPNGIEDMDLVDLIELLSDWCAATKRNKNGNIHKSIDLNTKKYNISPQLRNILENTVNRYF